MNVKKSKVMVCGPKELRDEDKGEWTFEGKKVERVHVYKYVGVMVDDGGTWEGQGEYIRERALDSFG